MESHRVALQELPDLTDRLQAMGISEEYAEYRERYLGWRRGKAGGAKGQTESIGRLPSTPIRGIADFAYWYPNVQEWRFRRTVSFWISITFLEGAIFFTISSFFYNYEDMLGEYFEAVTLGGYLWGKVHFFIGTYLMCVSSINLHPEGFNKGVDSSSSSGEEDSSNNDAYESGAPPRWRTNPFRVKTALANLAAVEAGPWPYLASLVYFTGVLTFAVGVAAELLPIPNEELATAITTWSFVLGSLQFILGGVFECIENDVFTACNINIGWIGAVLNLLGGIGFMVGSCIPLFSSSLGYWANISFGVGSICFLIQSVVMIIMWRDEQFGLTFLAVLNKLGGEHGQPIISTGESDKGHEHVSFSWWGIFCIHMYCFAGAMSCYNTNIELTNWMNHRTIRGAQLAFNEFIPCVIAHGAITLRSAVARTPRAAPYLQLFRGLEIFALFMAFNSALTFFEMIKTTGYII